MHLIPGVLVLLWVLLPLALVPASSQFLGDEEPWSDPHSWWASSLPHHQAQAQAQSQSQDQEQEQPLPREQEQDDDEGPYGGSRRDFYSYGDRPQRRQPRYPDPAMAQPQFPHSRDDLPPQPRETQYPDPAKPRQQLPHSYDEYDGPPQRREPQYPADPAMPQPQLPHSSYDDTSQRREPPATPQPRLPETPPPAQTSLTVGFYDESCPAAESVVRSTMTESFGRNPLLAAGILRLFFHDCFVRGCDGSVLLERRPGGPIPEKESEVNNNSITGFRVIDDAKKRLERMCPGVVSCADILALAARDAVWISGGPSWRVPTGRLDGRISLATEADNEIPSPDLKVRELRKMFLAKGLNTHDLVTLSGAHTIGRAHCFAFSDRLYNFSGSEAPDPTLNRHYLQSLQRICPRSGNESFTVTLDRDTQVLFDNSYFVQLLDSNGLLQTDQQLLFDSSTSSLVRGYATDASFFFRQFSRSMVRLSKVGIKSPLDGEIRRHCRRVNM